MGVEFALAADLLLCDLPSVCGTKRGVGSSFNFFLACIEFEVIFAAVFGVAGIIDCKQSI